MRYSKTKNETKQKKTVSEKKKPKKTDPLSLIIAEYGGEEIFDEENHSRLNKALMVLDDAYGQMKDWLLIANMKHIPQKMYAIRNSTQCDKQQTAEECRDVLNTLLLDQKTCEEFISYLATILNIDVSFEKRIEIKKITGFFNYPESDYDFYTTRHIYNTCQIEDKIWFAENLSEENFHIKGNLFKRGTCYSGIGKLADNKKYGCLYTWRGANICIPPGWRLPTVEDYQDLIAYIKSLCYGAGTALKSTNQWHGSAEKGLDLFGFCTYPTTRDSETGASQTWFWIASETNDSTYPHHCICIDANSNDVIIGRAGDDYHACVRYVKDVE